MFDNFKALLSNDTWYTAIVLILVALASFGLGRLSVTPVAPASAHGQIYLDNSQVATTSVPLTSVTISSSTPAGMTASAAIPAGATLVGSKNGTKYHLLTCPGAAQIKPENRVYFGSVGEATQAGYSPAANCPGL